MQTLLETLAERDRLYKVASDYWKANEKAIVRECPRLDYPSYFRLHARHDWRWAEGPESHFELTTPPA